MDYSEIKEEYNNKVNNFAEQEYTEVVDQLLDNVNTRMKRNVCTGPLHRETIKKLIKDDYKVDNYFLFCVVSL
jgi:glucosamine 6-phosphate synthetase-like amidotransferase/phosphosugar isomerase protein